MPHLCYLSHLSSVLYTISNPLYSRSVLFKNNNNFSSVFTNRLDRRMYETKFPTLVSFILFPFSICRIAVTCPTLKTSLSFMTVPVLSRYESPVNSRYESPVNCRNRKVQGNFTHKVNYSCRCNFRGLEFICRTKQGRKTRALRGISWRNAIAEVSHKSRSL